MVGNGGGSAGSSLADPTSPLPSHCALIVVTSTLRVNLYFNITMSTEGNMSDQLLQWELRTRLVK